MSVTVFNPRIDDAVANQTDSDMVSGTMVNAPVKLASEAAPAIAAKKVFITTQGCQMNVYDSGKMIDVLGDSHGMEVTYNIDEADVLLMNTCSIREKAQEKVFRIRPLAQVKRKTSRVSDWCWRLRSFTRRR